MDDRNAQINGWNISEQKFLDLSLMEHPSLSPLSKRD